MKSLQEARKEALEAQKKSVLIVGAGPHSAGIKKKIEGLKTLGCIVVTAEEMSASQPSLSHCVVDEALAVPTEIPSVVFKKEPGVLDPDFISYYPTKRSKYHK